MKKYLLILILLFCFESTFSQVLSETAKQKIQESLLNNNSLGNYFVVAFPPNDLPSNSLQILAIYISSPEDTKVYLSNSNGIIGQYFVNKGQVKTISTNNDLNWNMMLNDNDAEMVSQKGIIIESDKPISVYVLNSKGFSSEGYLAIPVKSWGTEYIHCSYWDFFEVRQWKTGLTVIAAEDRTKITVNLKGRSEIGQKTLKGKELEETYNKILNKGEIFTVHGAGDTRGKFDLTGTIITSDKPIGVISSHERTIIPVFTTTNGRDHLCSMIPPVSNWGKEYFSIELDRATNKGDYFRIVAGEDNTDFEVKWYEKKTGKFINSWSGTLEKKGDFDEYSKESAQAPHNIESIRGVSYFKSNKPIFVMQYSYSANWDKTPKGNFDPFMFPITSVEQYTKGTIFQTPSNSSESNEFEENFVNLIVLADAETEQERINKLNTIIYDGQQLTSLHPELLGQKFPNLGTEYDNKLYWVTIEPQIGPHIIFGDVTFGGYVYGFAQFDSYGWPAASGYNDLTSIDTIAPVIEVISQDNCGNITLSLTENTNYPVLTNCEDCLPQIDKGITQKPFSIIPENSYYYFTNNINYNSTPDLKEDEQWYGYPKLNKLVMDYSLYYKRDDAKLHIVIPDNTFNNFSEYTYNYYADKLFYDRSLEFIMIDINTTHRTTFKMKSDKKHKTLVEEIKLLNSKGEFYKLISPQAPFVIDSSGSVDVVIEYSPTRPFTEAEKYDDGSYDLDSLYIKTECLDFSFPIKGYAIDPTSVNSQDFTSFELFPNPASELINFKSNYSFSRFEVIDIKGNIALEGEMKSNSKSINIAKLRNGTYYLRLISDTQSQIGKFQKVK